MRVFNVQPAARPVYYDRNRLGKTQLNATIAAAPHTNTQRWSYTVPAARSAYLEALFLEIQRASVATTPGATNITITYVPNGGGTATLALDYYLGNGGSDTTLFQATNYGDMGAGDQLQASDVDNSTGGTVSFISTAKVAEFDA